MSLAIFSSKFGALLHESSFHKRYRIQKNPKNSSFLRNLKSNFTNFTFDLKIIPQNLMHHKLLYVYAVPVAVPVVYMCVCPFAHQAPPKTRSHLYHGAKSSILWRNSCPFIPLAGRAKACLLSCHLQRDEAKSCTAFPPQDALLTVPPMHGTAHCTGPWSKAAERVALCRISFPPSMPRSEQFFVLLLLLLLIMLPGCYSGSLLVNI